MRLVKIPKKSGGHRTICVPSREQKQTLRAQIPSLQRLVRQLCDLEIVHGFAEMRSPVTNALKHVGYEYTLAFDLADFFDSVMPGQLGGIGWCAAHLCDPDQYFHDCVARQGLPTSPMLANLAARNMDREIASALVRFGTRPPRAVYTRYADDLTISFDAPALRNQLLRDIPKIANNHGFEVNSKKTRVQCARAGRRIITGIAVGDDGIYPTRATKRKLRAALHNAKAGRVKHFPRRQWSRYVGHCRERGVRPMPQRAWLRRWLNERVRGLEEWCKLKPPQLGRRSLDRMIATEDPAEVLATVAARTATASGQ